MTHLRPLWSTDAVYVHHLSTEAETDQEIGPASYAEAGLTSITIAIRGTKTASGIPPPVRTMSRSSLVAKAVQQDITGNKDATHSEWITVCMVGPEIVNPTRDKGDIHEMLAGQADKKALNSYDLIRHLQNNVQV